MARFLQTPLKMLPRQIFSRRNRFPPLQRKVKTLFSSMEKPGCGNVFQVGHCHRLQCPLGLIVIDGICLRTSLVSNEGASCLVDTPRIYLINLPTGSELIANACSAQVA